MSARESLLAGEAAAMRFVQLDAAALRMELARRGWSATELARRTGVSPSYIRWVCRGAAPSPAIAAKIAEALGPEASALLVGRLAQQDEEAS